MNLVDTTGTGTRSTAFTQAVLDAACVEEHDWILDIGCGAGELARLAARRAVRGQVLGLDASRWKVHRARMLAADEELDNVRFVHGDIQTHRFEYGDFDVAFAGPALLELPYLVTALENIAHALAPGCRLVFLHPYGARPHAELFELAGFTDVYAEPALPLMIASAPGRLGPVAEE